MIPNTNINTIEIRTEPSLTWSIDLELDTLIGLTDEQKAVAQAVYLMLSIERYDFEIYPWSYGVELVDLIGSQRDFAIPEIKRRITEALLTDDRVTGVTDFTFTWERRTVTAEFIVRTVFGDLPVIKEVTV